jgi:hypothetical protein
MSYVNRTKKKIVCIAVLNRLPVRLSVVRRLSYAFLRSISTTLENRNSAELAFLRRCGRRAGAGLDPAQQTRRLATQPAAKARLRGRTHMAQVIPAYCRGGRQEVNSFVPDRSVSLYVCRICAECCSCMCLCRNGGEEEDMSCHCQSATTVQPSGRNRVQPRS